MALTRWIFVLLFGTGATALSAATYNVTSTGDSGGGTLRDAITQANATAGDDIITFGVTGTISLQTALPVITDNVSIDGPGRTALTIQRSSGASFDFRIFETNALGITLNINEVTLQGGRELLGGAILSRGATGLYDVLIQDCICQGIAGGGIALGGAIYHAQFAGLLTLTNCQIQNCHAIGGDNSTGAGGNAHGGAIHLAGGTLGMLSSTIDNCSATGGDATAGNADGGDGRGGGIYSVFAVGLTDCVVSNCTAMGGAGFGTGAGGFSGGGGILGEGAITSIDTTWQGNTATGSGQALGGAIGFDPSGTQQLTVTRSVLSGNAVTSTNSNAFGAAIASTGTDEIRESTISGSMATSGGTATTIHNESSNTFLMERSTVSGNTGGIVINSGPATIINSTISGNNDTTYAGGISTDTSTSISFCTITQNTGATTGGIECTGVVTVIGCIIAGNTGPTASTADFVVSSGTMTDGGGNVIGVDDAAVFTNAATQAGTSGSPLNAMLGALMDNGGLTFTHALLSGSPAIDNGGSIAVPGTDQRNAPRNVGVADSGAYEFGATVPGGQGKAGGEGDGRCSTGEGGLNWMLLMGLIAALGVGLRARRA